MNPDCRIYFVPYNGANPEWFLQEVERRKEHIDHVYCELPCKEMISHVRFTFDDKKSAGENPADVDAMRAFAGDGDTHLMQRLPMEPAANGNMAGTTQPSTSRAWPTNAATSTRPGRSDIK